MGEQRIVHIELDEATIAARSAEMERERKLAIHDLLEENRFEPLGYGGGPYRVTLGLEEGRLKMEISRDGAPDDEKPHLVLLPLTPFRKIIREYFVICDSYYAAIRTAAPAQIEAIDMGRRGLHNDGAELLRERLADKVTMDVNTSRRLFTLICMLQLRGRT
jgi:uncharacterized protein (UPF0262 family)